MAEPGDSPLVLTEPFDVRSVIRRSAPRIVRDALGPIVAFFIGWKLIGLVAGIGFATAFAILLYRRERSHGRPALVVRVALVLVLIRATVGLISGDAKVYLGQESEAQKDFDESLRLRPDLKAQLEQRIDLARHLRRVGNLK